MADMPRSARPALLGPEFEDFLFAPVGEDGKGNPLSVLSALARSNVDPWQEAAKLAGLTGEAAARRLAKLIAALPELPLAPLDPRRNAARLVALLPHRIVDRPSHQNSTGGAAVINYPAIIYAIVLVVVLVAQGVVVSLQAPPPSDTVDAPASSTSVSPPMADSSQSR